MPAASSVPVQGRGVGRSRTSPSPTAVNAVELAGLLHELTVRLLSADGLTPALERLAAFAVRVVPGVLRCSVVLIAEGGPFARAAAGTPGQGVDDRQYESGDGPSLEAARTRTLVTVQDLTTESRWPDLTTGDRWPELLTAAAAEGAGSVAAIPLDVQRTAVGSMTLFLAGPHGVQPDVLLTAMALAGQAEVLLTELRRRDVLGEGATVDRAAGVIIAQRGCGVQEAYGVLQETAQRLGLDREAVAERLIAAAARNAEN